MTDFYSHIPKDLAENLCYRLALRRLCRESVEHRRSAWAASKHDVLYFFNAFCWLYEPRLRFAGGRRLPMTVPFITWEHQDPCILKIKEFLGKRDIGLEKSRGEGASWIAVLLALHDWLFQPMSAIGFVSRDEQSVDNPEDPDSLFWKLCWGLDQLPKWMIPSNKRRVDGHTLRNLENGATISGYAATGNVASGGRKSWFLMDELAKFPRGQDYEAMASTQHVTECRLVVSTPKGSEGAYYDLMHKGSSLVKIVLDWKENPYRNVGLYRWTRTGADPILPGLEADYFQTHKELYARLQQNGFTLEGSVRAPWYDRECDRPGATPQNIAQELDRDYGGSQFKYFRDTFFAKAEETVKPPLRIGEFTFHPETLRGEFEDVVQGCASLWCSLDVQGRPPKGNYVVGADISAGGGGTHTSNSVLEVIDVKRMEQVFEYASANITPADFGNLAVALCDWFHDAYLIWEANGPGTGFTQRVLDLRYPSVYHRTILWRRGRKKEKKVGWWTDDNSKDKMFSELERAVKYGELLLRSRELVTECSQYVRNGHKIVHVASQRVFEGGAKGVAHGDRTIAAAVCLQGVRDRSGKRVSDEPTLQNPPPGSMAERMREHLDRLQSLRDPWDRRTNAELAAVC